LPFFFGHSGNKQWQEIIAANAKSHYFQSQSTAELAAKGIFTKAVFKVITSNAVHVAD